MAGVQVYYYYNDYPRDEWWIKVLVGLVYATDTASQALVSQICYTYLVTNYGNPAFLAHIEATLLPIMLLTGILSFGVQSFFLMRIWRLSNKNHVLTGGVAFLILAQFGITCAFFGIAHGYTTFAALQLKNHFMHGVAGVSAASDVAIALALTVLLHRSRAGFRKPERLVNRLILYTVNTGVLMGICAVLTLICNVAFPGTFIYMVFYLLVARIYTNSLFATLNTRDTLRRGGASEPSSNGMSSVPLGRINVNQFESKASRQRALSIKVDTETRHDDDYTMKRENTPPSSVIDVESGYGKPHAL